MKVVFIGSVEFSACALRQLISLGAQISLVVAKENPGINSDFSDLSEIARVNNIECLKTDNINDPLVKQSIKSKIPDYIFCFGWSQLLDKELLDIPGRGAIGYHPASLPCNRGRHPLTWALVLGLEKTGSTFFLMNAKADCGDIVSQKEIAIGYSDNAASLYKKMVNVALSQIDEFFPKLKENKISIIKQDDLSANYWRRRSKDDGQISWKMSSQGIYNLVRGLTRPYAGAHFVLGGQEVKVWKAEEVLVPGYSNIEYGKVLDKYADGSFLVKASDNCVKILDYQPRVEVNKGMYLL